MLAFLNIPMSQYPSGFGCSLLVRGPVNGLLGILLEPKIG